MINLTPIARNIQKRLFEKMKVLGRSNSTSPNQLSKSGDGLTHAKMSTRTTFLRMTSGQINPVTLMGGKVKDDGLIPAGYGDIYGTRSYLVKSKKDQEIAAELYNTEDFSGYTETQLGDIIDTGMRGQSGEKVNVNKSKRPTPGVKSVDVSFRGGVRALREATISWTCWDWEELNVLMPHFLAHGKTVLLEWGWVYDKKTFQNLPSFIDIDSVGNRFISADAFDNYRNYVIDANGDFDMMVGIIKNFEFTTREDGAFDCQTIISSVGASVLENPTPNKEAIDPNITYNITQNESERKTIARLREAVGYNRVETTPEESNSLVNLNTSVSMKLFIKELKHYLLERAYEEKSTQNIIEKSHFIIQPNKFLLARKNNGRKIIYDNDITEDRKKSLSKTFDNCWVRWGWFEDNILSKFLSVVSDEKIITEFRSVERILTDDGKDSNQYESVRIKNHSALETVNLNHCILPGQLYPVTKDNIEIDGKTIPIEGDSEYFHSIAKYVNDENTFSPFTTDSDFIERVGEEDVFETKTVKIKNRDYSKAGNLLNKFLKKELEPEYIDTTREVKTGTRKITKKIRVPSKYGYLRNMLINVKVIQEAFGVDNSDDFTVESINVVEAIEQMFSILNQDLNFWSYRLVVDEIDTYRAKIIDEQITNFDFTKSTNSQRTLEEDGVLFTENTWEEGVFFFPVWQNDSIVKRQNLSAKVPNAMALTAMYGSNLDTLKEFSNPGSQFTDKGSLIAGALFNKSLDKDKSGVDIAIRKPSAEKIGAFHGSVDDSIVDDSKIPISLRGGENIRDFLIKNADTLEESYRDRIKELEKNINVSSKKETQVTIFDSSVPPPLLGGPYLDIKQLKFILENEAVRREFLIGGTEVDLGELGKLIGAKFGDDTLEMKPELKGSVSYYTTLHGVSRQINTPVLVPFDLELEIDGIGGIYPGNSFQSTYLPEVYRENTVFQIFDVNHTLNDSTWNVTISGKMRSTISSVIDYKEFSTVIEEQLKEYSEFSEQVKKQQEKKPKDYISLGKFGVRKPTKG